MPTKLPRVALVTCAALPNLYAEESEIVPRLRARGVDAVAAVWTDPDVDWRRFDALFLRSTWDYVERFAEFAAWLDRVEPLAPMWNPAPLVRWNSDKIYLRDLAAHGVEIVESVFFERGARADLASVVAERGWDRAVLKPTISAGAHRTHRFDARAAATLQPELDAILAESGAMIQPFLQEIQTIGESSFFFFDGALSHAVNKLPAVGDYRVQAQFGGTAVRFEPTAALLARAQAVVDALPIAPAYARIDAICRGDALSLMEAELIEPYLFGAAAPDAIDAYVRLVDRFARR